MPATFTANASEALIIAEIASRYLDELSIARIPKSQRPDKLSVIMDIEAAHSNGCPLKLTDLCNAEAFDLVHDVGGIGRHINRTTGKLGGHFLPRYAK